MWMYAQRQRDNENCTGAPHQARGSTLGAKGLVTDNDDYLWTKPTKYNTCQKSMFNVQEGHVNVLCQCPTGNATGVVQRR